MSTHNTTQQPFEAIAREAITRRSFLTSGIGAAAMLGLSNELFAHAANQKPRHILLRSSWQTVNIGDIAHTPGALKLLTTYLPDARLTLWPSEVDRGVDAMLLKSFPKLRIIKGKLDTDGQPLEPELRQAFAEADFMLHGSGPSVVAQAHLAAWRKVTGKPYGIYGVTISEVNEALRELLNNAKFVFCRDTISLDLIKKQELKAPVMGFAPDATFALDWRDDAQAQGYLKTHNLEDRKFICAIPRLRYTPYYKIRQRAPNAEDLRREAVSDKYQEIDHAKLREAIIVWVRKTGLKVLACPEMTYEVEVAKRLLVDPLPADVKRNVVWRDTYWSLQEAASVYARAHTVVSFEMHSPIIAAVNGTPAFYLRQPTDTSKGQMWRDIGLNEWIFEIDETPGESIARTLLSVHADYPAAQRKLKQAMEYVKQRQRETMVVVGGTGSHAVR